mgnify:CR=1 FL=1|jgi:tRNA splicing endonuclease|tara:strand:- start:1626 stop:2639 length:1014 start_codon:yes stop_codon:yes gene_type:complete
MEAYKDDWLYSGSASERLWNKSAIGKKINNNQLLLSASEVIFCHNHRHLDWPNENWFEEEISKNPNLINESIVVEALRVPGNKLMLTKFIENNSKFLHHNDTWGVRWNSSNHPRKDLPEAEVRWFHSSEMIDRENLLSWAIAVSQQGHKAEVLIVDNEQAVVTYNITVEEPRGELLPPTYQILETISKYKKTIIDNDKIFVHYGSNWPCEQIGIDYDNGRIIDKITNELFTVLEEDYSRDTSVLYDLLMRGLHPRPGFKYGTLWRCYEQKIGTDHAPWLVVNPSNKIMNWESACLASRLASGVNKIWLQPLKHEEKWKYLGIVRPAANSRWTNPIKK